MKARLKTTFWEKLQPHKVLKVIIVYTIIGLANTGYFGYMWITYNNKNTMMLTINALMLLMCYMLIITNKRAKDGNIPTTTRTNRKSRTTRNNKPKDNKE